MKGLRLGLPSLALIGGLVLFPMTAATAPAAAQTEADKASRSLLVLTNGDRSSHGERPLAINPLLEKSASLKCADLIRRNYWGHITPDGKDASYFLNRAGIGNFSIFGENLAIGQSSAGEANADWMASPGHRNNILNPKYTDAGFAECTYSGGNPDLPALTIYVEHLLAK